MKPADIRAMTIDQIDDEVLKLKKEHFNLRFQRASGQLENTARVREVRRDIARLKTIARNKRPVVAARRVKRNQMPKRTLQGVVVSDKQAKTVVVQGRAPLHPSAVQEDGSPLEEVLRARREERIQSRRHGVDRRASPDLQAQALGGGAWRKEEGVVIIMRPEWNEWGNP